MTTYFSDNMPTIICSTTMMRQEHKYLCFILIPFLRIYIRVNSNIQVFKWTREGFRNCKITGHVTCTWCPQVPSNAFLSPTFINYRAHKVGTFTCKWGFKQSGTCVSSHKHVSASKTHLGHVFNLLLHLRSVLDKWVYFKLGHRFDTINFQLKYVT